MFLSFPDVLGESMYLIFLDPIFTGMTVSG